MYVGPLVTINKETTISIDDLMSSLDLDIDTVCLSIKMSSV